MTVISILSFFICMCLVVGAYLKGRSDGQKEAHKITHKWINEYTKWYNRVHGGTNEK